MLKKRLSFNSPIINIGSSQIYEEDDYGDCDEDFAVNVGKTLASLPAGGIKNGSSVTIEDFQQDLECVIQFTHRDTELWDEEKTPDMFVVGTKVPGDDEKKKEETVEEKGATSKKRKMSSEDGAASKKAKVADDDGIEIL